MPDRSLPRIIAWFATYTRSFLSADEEADSALHLKIDHTARVRTNMRRLADAIGLSADHRAIAQIIGQLHDVGRFEQYVRYGTFADSRSVNHAALGVEIIREHKVLAALDKETRRGIEDAVRLHNAPSLPQRLGEPSLTFLRLIRDADKLDIWKVFGDYYREQKPPETAIVQHLPDRPTWNASIVDAMEKGCMARFDEMETLTDFKLLQLSWVFDLNFEATASLAMQYGDLAAIAKSLPHAPDLHQAVATVVKKLETLAEKGQKAVPSTTKAK